MKNMAGNKGTFKMAKELYRAWKVVK